MRTVCCIPATRADTLPLTVSSAKDDGWDVLVEWDSKREGPAVTRNRLFQQALALGYDVIRWADDDDLVLPHRKETLEELQDCDVVYHDHILQTDVRHYIAAPTDLVLAVYHPPDVWGTVSRISALQRLTINGDLWPAQNKAEGFFMFLRMLQRGLKIRHLGIPSYEYHVGQGIHTVVDNGYWRNRYTADACNWLHHSPSARHLLHL